MKNTPPPEWQEEWDYRYQERLGIMCGNNVPTEEQERIARQESDEAIGKLKSLSDK